MVMGDNKETIWEPTEFGISVKYSKGDIEHTVESESRV
jgi:hypothetical protein